MRNSTFWETSYCPRSRLSQNGFSFRRIHRIDHPKPDPGHLTVRGNTCQSNYLTVVRWHVKQITYTTIQDTSFPQGSLSPNEMSFTVGITIYQRSLKDEPCTHSLLKVKRLRSVLIRSPLRSVHVVSEKRCRAQRRTQRTDARRARGELVYFPDGRGALRGHCPPAETCAFYFRYKSTFKSHYNYTLIN